MPEETFVIVGASLAGAKAAETLREEGFRGRVVLIGDEIERPYERPPLSKGFLLGKEPRDKAHVHEPDWYDKHDVDLRLGARVDGFDRVGHEVRLASGERLGYDRLLLATGASPRRLDVPGAKLQGIHYLRTMSDSAALREALSPGGRRVVVAGAGWIGMEAAAAARGYGNDVTVIEPEPAPLYAAVGPEIGGVFADLHREHGVDLRLDQGVAGFWGAGQVSAVVTSGGAEVPADVVVVGIGVRPNTRLAEEAGLEVSDGILVDQSLCTSDPDVYAAGDVASAYHPLLGRRIRVEHWANALNGGSAGGPRDARAGGELRPRPVLLQRSVRPRHGDVGRRGAGRVRRGRLPGRRPGPRVRRVLAVGRAGRRGHERQRVGRDRRRSGADQVRPTGRSFPARRPEGFAGRAGLNSGPRRGRDRGVSHVMSAWW